MSTPRFTLRKYFKLKYIFPLFIFILILLSINSTYALVEQKVVVSGGATACENQAALLKLPDDYNSTTKDYPILIFFNGNGEVPGVWGSCPSSNTTYISGGYLQGRADKWGPSHFIETGQMPSSFTNPVTGKQEQMIFLSAQRPNNSYNTGESVNSIINYMVDHYRVDPNRIYITGLSSGGGITYIYLTYPQATHLPAAAVPMSLAVDLRDYNIDDGTNYVKSKNINVWGFGSPASDFYGQETEDFITSESANDPGLGDLGRFTNYSGGHCCWNNFYTPSYTETIATHTVNGITVPTQKMNIYEWMLQYSRANVPTVTTGPDQTITLPTNSVTLTGNGSDSNSTIASHIWSKVTGSGTITSPNAYSTTVTGLQAGTSTFRLLVTDKDGNSNYQDVNIFVRSGNVVPSAKAGNDKTITLPTNSVTLTGSGTDSDGTIKTYAWSKVSGSGTIVSPNSATTNVTGLTVGTSIFKLTVTDNDGATDTDTVQIVLKTKETSIKLKSGPDTCNQVPALLYLPDDYNSTTKNYPILIFAHGSGESYANGDYDTYGTQATCDSSYDAYKNGSGLSKIYTTNGPAHFIETGAWPSSFTDPVNSQQYKFIVVSPQALDWSLTGTQLSYVIQDLVNKYRVDTNRIYLTGLSAGGQTTFRYVGHSVPGDLTSSPLYKAAAAVPMSMGSADLWSYGATGVTNTITDQVHVWGFAGPYSLDPTRTKEYIDGGYSNIPVGGLGIFGRFTNTGKSHCCWNDYYTPTYTESVLVHNVNGVNVPTQNMNIYEWMLQYDRSDIHINSSPIAKAGSDQTLTLPTSNATLNANSSSDSDGTIKTYAWSKVSGAGTIVSPSSATTNVTGLTVGTSVFKLTVTDNDGATSSDEVNMTVHAALNKAPIATTDIVTVDENSSTTVNILNNDTDADHDTLTISSVTTPSHGSASVVNGQVKYTPKANYTGADIFHYVVDDGHGGTDTGTVNVTVNTVTAPNIFPTASAGSDQTITLPTNSVALAGNGTDSDGSISSHAWSKVSGAGTITSSNSYSTNVTGLTEGTSVFKLTVTDNDGATSSDEVSITVNPTKVTGHIPTADAGKDITIHVPIDWAALDGSKSRTYGYPNGGGMIYNWSQVSGPATNTIIAAGSVNATATRLAFGTYVFKLTVKNYDQNSASDEVTITVVGDTTSPGNVPYTANTQVPAYNGDFAYGSNPGYYGANWSSPEIYNLISKAGGHSTRSSQPDSFITKYGIGHDLSGFQEAYNTDGLQDNVMLIDEPSSEDRATTTYEYTDASGTIQTVRSKLWKGMYLPIWDNGENGTPINDNNTFAKYLYNVLLTYGPYVKFWEIVNEPDFTYSPGPAGAGPGTTHNWWDSNPSPSYFANTEAPVTAYIRTLRVAYEVIKKYYPNSYVCPGGLGYTSFLDAVLRNTDNPNGGSVTSAYPLKGGAYFDCMSWHIYPQYSTHFWSHDLGNYYIRHSDYLAEDLQTNHNNFMDVLSKYGYNNSTYPKKVEIVTENNVARKQIGATDTGGSAMQINFVLKELLIAQRIGIRQMYWYQTGESQDYNTATSPFGVMGLYNDLEDLTPGTEALTGEGLANLTASKLLYGWQYDPVQSAKLNLPSNLDGGAFKKDGQYRYLLWAKTTKDESEVATGTYTFPNSLGLSSLNRVEWNYALTGQHTTGDPNLVYLTATPSFFIPTNQSLPAIESIKVIPDVDPFTSSNNSPVASAGNDQSITLPTNSVTLAGNGADSDGNIKSYLWTKVTGSGNISTPNSKTTEVTGLAVGTSTFKLTVTDNDGAASEDEVSIKVNTTIPNTTNTTETLPKGTGENAASSTDSKGRVVGTLVITPPQTITLPLNITSIYSISRTPSYAGFGLTQVSGPTTATIVSQGATRQIIENLSAGTYVFVGHASSNGNSVNTYATTTITVLPDTTTPGDVNFTANTFVPNTTTTYGYGTNSGYYPGTPWLGQNLYDLIPKAGGHAVRTTLPDDYLSNYGITANLDSFKYFTNDLGLQGNVVFVDHPSPENQATTTFDGKRSKLWKGMYLPIWDNGENGTPINDNNKFAQYIYKVVKTYGQYIPYWEIINEPDYTYATTEAGNPPTADDNWWTKMPPAGSTPNLNAPVTSYIRLLRIAYEVIKKYYPNEYICTGGLGYSSYLDAILRYTDNPDGGTVTSQYPLTGGAYMDCLSWHIYPEFSTYKWVGANVPGNIGGFEYQRNSDYISTTAFANSENSFNQVLDTHGYNGTDKPKKIQIVTENGISSRQVSTTGTGGTTILKNFTIKASVEAQRLGLQQMFWYGLAGVVDDGTDNNSFNHMELMDIKNPDGSVINPPELKVSGIANVTMSSLLYGWQYDANKSALLNLPSTVDGAAFKKNGQYRYVLWAKTTGDENEEANAIYSFPSSFGIAYLNRVEWNYSYTNKIKSNVSPKSISLTSSPSFFIPSDQTIPTIPTVPVIPTISNPSQAMPTVLAGADKSISLPNTTVTLTGKATPNNDGTIDTYHWTKVSGANNVKIVNPNSANTEITNLSVGTYTFKLTATDSYGNSGDDSLQVTVKGVPPTVSAGPDRTISLPTTSLTIHGTAAGNDGATIVSYKWSKRFGSLIPTIVSPNSSTTVVKDLSFGSVALTLTVTDSSGNTNSGWMTIHVNNTNSDPTKVPPSSFAGLDQNITLPTNNVTLTGNATVNNDGHIISYTWSKISGPNNYTFTATSSASTQVNNLVEGTYTFRLTAKDSYNNSNSDDVTITVNSKPNSNSGSSGGGSSSGNNNSSSGSSSGGAGIVSGGGGGGGSYTPPVATTCTDGYWLNGACITYTNSNDNNTNSNNNTENNGNQNNNSGNSNNSGSSSIPQAVITTPTLNVRTSPTTASDVLTQIHKGDKVEVLDTLPGWLKIRTNKGAVSYISSDYAQVTTANTSETDTNSSSNPNNDNTGNPSNNSSSASGSTYTSITTPILNVRTSPTTASDVTSQVHLGETVKVLQKLDNWLKVKANDGSVGYVYSLYTAGVQNSTPTTDNTENANTNNTSSNNSSSNASNNNSGGTETASQAVITTPTLNVRTSPTTASDVLTQIHKGDKVEVLDTLPGWLKIRTNKGAVSYISSDYAQITNTNSNSSTNTNQNNNSNNSTSNNIGTNNTNNNIPTTTTQPTTQTVTNHGVSITFTYGNGNQSTVIPPVTTPILPTVNSNPSTNNTSVTTDSNPVINYTNPDTTSSTETTPTDTYTPPVETNTETSPSTNTSTFIPKNTIASLRITSNNVNVYSSDSLASSILTTLNEGDKVSIVEVLSGWFHIFTDSGLEGYIKN